MSRPLAFAYRLLGLLHPTWALRTGPLPGAASRRRGARGVRLSEERRSGEIQGGVPIESLVRCTYTRARIRGPVLAGEAALCSLMGAVILQARAEPGARITASNLDFAVLQSPELSDLSWSGCALREAEIELGALGRLSLCDLAGARLHEVRVDALLACDLSGASLRGCDLRGADLRGSSFRNADLRGAKLDGALVAGADFIGARGLDAATREQLIRGGAALRGAWLLPTLQRLMPGSAPAARHRAAAGLSVALKLGFGAVLLGSAALTLRPPDPLPTPPPAPVERSVGAQERQETQRALSALRESVARAHEAMLERGAAQHVWPTLVELQNNRYDTDGEGPAEVWETLVHGGLPDNTLTSSRGGVLPYCEDDPRQESLRGVDCDWYYCELTGRVFASAGFTEEATLNW